MLQKFRKPTAAEAATGETEAEALEAPPAIEDALKAAEAAQHQAASEAAAKALQQQIKDAAAKAKHEAEQRALDARRKQSPCGCW